MTWSLQQLLAGLHADIHHKLSTARASFGHPVSKGDASEAVWLAMLTEYLPKRYTAAKAHVVDSKGEFSDQIDVVIYDRQYTPLIFSFQGETIIPAESVYAVFEAKQAINASQVKYAQDKIESVRRLHRTSLPVPHVEGLAKPKALPHILGGLLTFDSDWNPPLGNALTQTLCAGSVERCLDLGCVAKHGIFTVDAEGTHTVHAQDKAATAFLLELIARLQNSATVPMIDVRAYAAFLVDRPDDPR